MNYLSSRRLSVLLSLGIVVVLIAGYAGVGEEESRTESAESPEDNTTSMGVSYGFEAKNREKLVGFAENVFTGRVVEQVGSEEMSDPEAEGLGIPQTQFAVQPLDNIKGDLKNPVTVNQLGGTITQNGEKKKILIEGDPLLEPGKEYLFVTRYAEGENWYTIAAQPFGDIKVEEEKRKEIKEKFEKAKKNQKDPAKEFSKK